MLMNTYMHTPEPVCVCTPGSSRHLEKCTKNKTDLICPNTNLCTNASVNLFECLHTNINMTKRVYTPGALNGPLAEGAILGICPLGEFYCLTPFEKGKQNGKN